MSKDSINSGCSVVSGWPPLCPRWIFKHLLVAQMLVYFAAYIGHSTLRALISWSCISSAYIVFTPPIQLLVSSAYLLPHDEWLFKHPSSIFSNSIIWFYFHLDSPCMKKRSMKIILLSYYNIVHIIIIVVLLC